MMKPRYPVSSVERTERAPPPPSELFYFGVTCGHILKMLPGGGGPVQMLAARAEAAHLSAEFGKPAIIKRYTFRVCNEHALETVTVELST